MRLNHGFSLVELSIVLVILGLLTGGILAGQSLIRAAELRSVTTDAQRVLTAVNTFRDKYFAVPGDMTNATSFWPTAANGNGDGIVTNTTGGAGNAVSENFQFWMQLALAGLVEGSYTGRSGPAYPDCVIGSNCPRTKLSNVTMLPIDFIWSGTGTNGWWGPTTAGRGNWLVTGSVTSSGAFPFSAAFKPEELWNIDTKIDDGSPTTGAVMHFGCSAYGLSCSVTSGGAAPGTDCNAFAAAAPVYNLGNSTNSCAAMFRFN